MRTNLNASEVLEITANGGWTKSGRSGSAGHCVQVARINEGVAVSNSNHPEAGAIVFTDSEWTAFRGGVTDGDFDAI